MGADLYESYCGSILATAALGAAAFIHSADTVMQFKAVIAPMLIAAVGILLSIIGIFSVRTKENATVKDLLGSLAFGTNLSSVLIVAATFLILWLLQLDNWIWISCAVVVGLLVGIVIGRSTEYYTSQSYRPTQKLSESGKTGPATVIISGIGLGTARLLIMHAVMPKWPVWVPKSASVPMRSTLWEIQPRQPEKVLLSVPLH